MLKTFFVKIADLKAHNASQRETKATLKDLERFGKISFQLWDVRCLQILQYRLEYQILRSSAHLTPQIFKKALRNLFYLRYQMQNSMHLIMYVYCVVLDIVTCPCTVLHNIWAYLVCVRLYLTTFKKRKETKKYIFHQTRSFDWLISVICHILAFPM